MSQNSNILYLNFLKKAGISFFLQDKPSSLYEKKDNNKNISFISKISEIKTLKELELLINNANSDKSKKNYNEIIIGEGNEEAEILIIGENSIEENGKIKILGNEPKQLLNKMIKSINLDINNIYIANIIPSPIDKNKSIENKEILQWLPFVQRQIEIINPKLILLLGPLAAKSILNSNLDISKLRGKWHDYKSINLDRSIKCLTTYHPEHLIKYIIDKKSTWEDLQIFQKKI